MSQNLSTQTGAARHLRITRFLFFAICGFVAIALVAALLIVLFRVVENALNTYGDTPVIIMAVISAAAIIIARSTFNKGINEAKNSLNALISKLNRYRSALLMHLAICEAAAMLNVVGYIFTGRSAFLILAAILLGCMLASMPSARRLATDLQLDAVQQQELF